MWIKSIYGKAAFKRLKLYIWRAGTVTATPECQWPCGWWWVGARSFGLGSVTVRVVMLQNMVRAGWGARVGQVPVCALGLSTLLFRETDVVGDAPRGRSSLALANWLFCGINYL